MEYFSARLILSRKVRKRARERRKRQNAELFAILELSIYFLSPSFRLLDLSLQVFDFSLQTCLLSMSVGLQP